MSAKSVKKDSLNVAASVYTDVAGTAATGCFGVKGMAGRSMKDGLYHLLRKESASKGVDVEFHQDGSITIELHVIVEYGVSLPAVSESIISEVRYVVENTTGTKVRNVVVYMDSMSVG